MDYHDDGNGWRRAGLSAGAGTLTMGAIFHQFEAFTGISIFTALFAGLCISSLIYFLLQPSKGRSDWVELLHDVTSMVLLYCCFWDEW